VANLPLNTFSLQCLSANQCVAIDGSGPALLSSTDGGRNWARKVVPHTGHFYIDALSCFSTKDCVIAATHGGNTIGGTFIERTSNGGRTWTQQSLPKGNYLIYNIDCRGANSYIAVGQEIGANDNGPGVIFTYG
jgi:photosystem II stability/assembly factor-like uncharacterized protein